MDLVAGLPPDLEHHPTAPEYVQQMWEQLELAHQITREALGDSVTRERDGTTRTAAIHSTKLETLCGISGTRHVKNKVKKFLPSYEGPFFVLGQLG